MKQQADVLVVGGGIVGLTTACLLASQGVSVAVLEKNGWPSKDAVQPASLSPRVSALHEAAWVVLEQTGAMAFFSTTQRCDLRSMEVWDGVGHAQIQFDCVDMGAPRLGVIAENSVLRAALHQCARALPLCALHEGVTLGAIEVASDAVEVRTDKGVFKGRVVLAADGALSWVRSHLAMPFKARPYHHTALTGIVRSSEAHQHQAWQCFMPQGPLGLLPLREQDAYGFVWSLLPEKAEAMTALAQTDFNLAISDAIGWRCGDLSLDSKIVHVPLVMRHAQAYVRPRIALLGDAAHTVHPLAGQGMNLGLMDAQSIARSILSAHRAGDDVGRLPVLRRYEREQKGAHLAMLATMRAFKNAFASEAPWVVQARNRGFDAVEQCAFLKKTCMAYAMGRWV